MITNLNHAIEGLSEAEMKDLSGDFKPLAQQTPAEVEINSEIITNNLVTVTAKLPKTETGMMELTKIEVRREKDAWMILTADEQVEALVKKVAKNYFFVLKMDIHQTEAQAMMERIAKAQTLSAMQNRGVFADLPTLVSKSLLPEDINIPKTTDYRFTLALSGGNKKYFANAVPDIYDETGKLSFLSEGDGAD